MTRNCLQGLGRIGIALIALGTAAGTARGDEPLKFNRDIRPILAEYCWSCHGFDSAARQADLRLDERAAAIDSGAIVPHDPDSSELIARLLTDDPDLIMPPPESKKTVSEKDRELLRRWIAEGAEFEPHWAFVPPQRPDLPSVQNREWIKQPLDHFVLAALERRGWQPQPEAEPRALFRRVHWDLTGLPAPPAAADAFATDYAARGEAALADAIDRLQATPAWGEHRARYWLDTARYADTHGMHFDNYREMWPYRDWVIKAFNRNQPFDQFVVEQLAGDLLPQPTTDQLVATGFQRCNITTNEGGTIEEENLALYAADRVQTFGWVFLGLTTNCAQCHDHKFDPFTMRDYYSLAAFFRNTTQSGLDGNSKDGRAAIVTLPTDADLPRWQALPSEIAAAKQAREDRRVSARATFETWLASLSLESLESEVSSAGLEWAARLNDGDTQRATERNPRLTAVGEPKWEGVGKFGPAATLQPGATWIAQDTGDFDLGDSFSFGGWVRAADNRNMGGIIARMDEKADYRGWDLWHQGGAFAVHLVDRWPENALKVRTRDNAVQPGEWQHVFVSYDGTGKTEGIKLYLNGRLENLIVENNSLRPDASLRTTTPTRLGQRSDQQLFRGGSLQDVRIYRRILSGDEIASLARNGLLEQFLQTPSAERTVEQTEQLFQHYLEHVDAPFIASVAKVQNLEQEYEAIRQRSPITHIQEERRDQTPMTHLLLRGEYDKKGDSVPAATPSALPPLAAGEPLNRLGLARWVVAADNPLFARVTVNRFWQELFGTGLVATPEDFGIMGLLPSHPELLDWLALEFREQQWDTKRWYKTVLMSATYRQAAGGTSADFERDPQNTWLARGPRFRLDAEMIRDQVLAVSGLLSSKMYGPGVKPYQPEGIWDVVGLPEGNTRIYQVDQGENLYRRSLYNFWKRMAPPPNLEALNAPSREVCTVRRERTNTPLQALVTLNDPQFFEAARVLAQGTWLSLLQAGNEAVASGTERDERQLQEMARRVLSRNFSPAEMQVLLADLAAYRDYYLSHPPEAAALVRVGQSPVESQIPEPELAAWTLVANQVLNLDEALNK